MEEGAHVWLHSSKSEWGWLPARISKKQVVLKKQKHHKKVEDVSVGSSRFRNNRPAAPPSNFPPPINRSVSNSSRSSIGGGGNAALIKELEDKRRKELQTLMRDRSLEKDARKSRMDEVKAKYAKLVEEAKNAPPPEPEPAPQAAQDAAAVPPPPTEEEKKDLPPEELPPEMTMIELTLVDDFTGLEDGAKPSASNSGYGRGISGYYAKMEHFKEVIYIDSTAAREEHPDIKLRNMPSSCSASSIQFYGESNVMNKGAKDNHMPDPAAGQPGTKIQDTITGGVDDLIGLTHLHEPAILHALRLRYDADIIYTSTGPILLAINPFKNMNGVYGKGLMDLYRQEGEERMSGGTQVAGATGDATIKDTKKDAKDAKGKKGGKGLSPKTGKKAFIRKPLDMPLTDDGQPIPRQFLHRPNGKLPPHVYKAADDAYRAMMRGIEMKNIMKGGGRGLTRGRSTRGGMEKKKDDDEMPTNQSILVSGESGAGKTVTTKIVLNYFAMLSKKTQEDAGGAKASAAGLSSRQLTGGAGGKRASAAAKEDVSIEQQVLQSNPILEAFGNARTIRNDNSSRFGKYINIAFTDRGQLVRASIDTYLLEKVRLIHQTHGERNFHVFYQFLASATDDEREELLLNGYTVQDFNLTNQSDTYDRRDQVDDVDMHDEMVDAMEMMQFGKETTDQLMRLVVAVLFAGNMTFASGRSDTAILEETEASLAVAQLLGVSFDNLAASLTSKVIFARGDMIHKGLDRSQAEKASEALIKSIYGAAFDFIAAKINQSINAGTGRMAAKGGKPGLRRGQSSSGDEPLNIVPPGGASIGVLDIFGFETFEVNAFEQLCINYTNETLQQQFNKFVFKLEQQEYEREGILWKFIPFPDNQDVLDLIDKPRTGILQILDEQCIVDWGTDKKFSLSLYSTCDQVSDRFHVSPAQRVRNKFAVEHYAGFVEYSTENWLEKNKDQLPAATAELLESSDFPLIGEIKGFVRSEGAKVTMKSLGKQFSESLKVLRHRIDATMPHYVRCLKPNDALEPDNFDPKNIVEQLRYCGVLEAVRVSRAGYPTRYPHEVFVTRYYMLCPDRTTDTDNLSPYHHEISANLTEDQKQLKRLVSRVATEIWKIEHEIFQRSSASNNRPEPPSDNRHALAQPTNIEEFMRLDFSSRCAVAGLQLGKTKVFLRREAFECIESIRNEKFGKNVTRISKTWRRYAAQEYLRRAKLAAVMIQCTIRMALASKQTAQLMKDFKAYLRMKAAATKIQRCFRNHDAVTNKEGQELRQKKAAIVTIQGAMRGRMARRRVGLLVHSIARFQSQVRTVKVREEYLEKRNAIIKMQSLVRVLLAAHDVEEARRQRAAKKIQSIVRMKWVFMDFRRRVDAASLIKRAYREHLYQERTMYGAFLKKYYMLGDPNDVKKGDKAPKKKKVMLARHRNALINAKKLELTKLMNKLTLDLWEPGMFESFEKPHVEVRAPPPSKPTPVPESARPTPQAAPAPAPAPPEPEQETPGHGKKKKFGFSLGKKKSAGAPSPPKTAKPAPKAAPKPAPKPASKMASFKAKVSMNGKSNKPKVRPSPCPLPPFTPIPQTKKEFMTRLAPSRYALVGLQMANGEIFMRPETYARLEMWKNNMVGGSSAKIQAAARRKLVLNDMKRKKAAAVVVQSFFRMQTARSQLQPMRLEYAATRIQSVFRMSRTRKGVWRTYWSTQSQQLFDYIGEDNWYMVEKMLHKNPLLVEEADPTTGELPLHKIVEHASAWTLLIDMILTLYPKAVVHKDFAGQLPIHHAAHADNLTALEIIYESYRNGAKDADESGCYPIHVAAESGSIESIKYLTMKVPDSVHTVTSGGSSLPLHLACKEYSSVGVITSLLRTPYHFTLAGKTDENGELPLHLLLRCGAEVDVVAVKTLLTCHLKAVGTRDQAGDIPLHIALKNNCKPAVIETLLSHFPGSSVVMDGEGHSPLFLALSNSAEDETSVALIKYAPHMVTLKDDRTAKLPIEVATENQLSLFIVYRLLKQDMPIDLKERVQVRLIPHHYSWNHILLDVGDRYYQVVSKILQQCTQPQVLALAHVEDSKGLIALASATPICRHEIRVMLRLFNTLELVKQRPAFTNGASDTEIFYALRYEPPPEQSDLFSTDYDGKEADAEDFTEDWDDDLSQMSNASRVAMNEEEANLSVAEKLKVIRNEKGQHVIAKITPRSDIVERELKVRKDFNLSRHYVPSVISVHHTVHHGAYQNASAEAAYCITMEGADSTIEHQMLDYRRAGKAWPASELKRVGVSLLHLHENGLVHTDFGPHSVGKFGPLFKLLGVGGCVAIGGETDPKHGIYHPPEAISVESIEVDGKERKTAKVVPVTASVAIDIWAFGNMVYEAMVGAPLSAYSHRGQRVKSSNLAKIAKWDDHSLQRALRFVDSEDTLVRDVISKFLHPDPAQRFQSIREAIADPFFNTDMGDRKINKDKTQRKTAA